ncbi:nucleotidyltransferase family protein [Candidatus Woesearchaeota archaeon]|nr:nucleotidyltransferase family protein [Candidatus Woesearchaeota archaeon]
MKERVTLTLETELLEQVDKRIDGIKVKNRSHAVELMLYKALGKNKPILGLILAGGKGTRLKPITHEIPKPLVPLQGKPIIEYTMELFKKFGIKDVLLSIGYKGDKIKDYYGNGKRHDLNIIYLEEDKPLGTGGPLKLAKQYLTDTFVMCNADELKSIDLEEMYYFHKKNNAVVTIALTTVKDPSAYGVARLEGSKILEFIEKPKKEDAPSNLINSGLYIMEPEVLKYLPENQETVSIEKDVFPRLAQAGKLYGYPFSGQWFDTGTLERYEKAIAEWKGL